ncbi:MAG: hypothetical protein JSS66_08900 [Armatimonadetes bacterium]|nr:hypothetical protein [Armatimonadota bacterium]
MEDRRKRPYAPPLDPRAVVIMRKMAGEYADRYAQEFLLPHIKRVASLTESDKDSVAAALEDPYCALLAFFGHYAFARRGKDRDDLAGNALDAMKKMVSEKPFEEVLDMADGTLMWQAFESVCKASGKKANEQQNRGPVQGMLELAQEIHRLDPELSLATWVTDGIEDTGHLEAQHLRIVDIRGVGPKSASTFIRDMVWLYDVEELLVPTDRVFVQPVDRWLRMMTPYVVPEEGLADPADWIVAGKISKYTRRAGLSGICFNMGTTYFGQKVVGDPSRFESAIRDLLVQEVDKARGLKASGEPGEGHLM